MLKGFPTTEMSFIPYKELASRGRKMFLIAKLECLRNLLLQFYSSICCEVVNSRFRLESPFVRQSYRFCFDAGWNRRALCWDVSCGIIPCWRSYPFGRESCACRVPTGLVSWRPWVCVPWELSTPLVSCACILLIWGGLTTNEDTCLFEFPYRRLLCSSSPDWSFRSNVSRCFVFSIVCGTTVQLLAFLKAVVLLLLRSVKRDAV